MEIQSKNSASYVQDKWYKEVRDLEFNAEEYVLDYCTPEKITDAEI